MIIITGPTGSGKTELQKELERRACSIIPLYTTRKPRENDFFKICMSDEEFCKLMNCDGLIVHTIYNTEIGVLRYGISKMQYHKALLSGNIPVIEGTYGNIKEIKYFATKEGKGDIPFIVFVDIDYETMVSRTCLDNTREDAMKDMKRRWDTDKEEFDKLKKDADLVISNNGTEHTPVQLATTVLNAYLDYVISNVDTVRG